MKTDPREKNAETGEDSLRLRYQDKAYNEIYKQWRKKNQDSMGFYFLENSSKVTYQDGVGIIKDFPEVREKHALEKVFDIVGKCMLFCVLCDAFSKFLLPRILHSMGFDIQYDFFMDKLYGNPYLVTTLDFLTTFIPRLLVCIFLAARVRLPFKVILPMKVTNKHMFRVCVPAMLLVSGVCCLMAILTSSVFRTVQIRPDYFVTLPESVPEAIYLIVTQIIVVSVVREAFCRGMMMQLIRQFGDGFAIIVTSFIMASANYDVSKFFYSFISAMVIGYFTLRTGSVLTAVIMKVTYLAFIYAISFIYYNFGNVYENAVLAAFLFAVISIGLIFVIRFLYLHSDCFGMTMKNRYLPLGSKFLLVLSNVSVIMWLTGVTIITVIFTSLPA